MNTHDRPLSRGLITFAALVISVAGLKLASSIIVPVITAAFLTVIISSGLSFLRKSRMPSVLVLPVGAGVVATIFVIFGLILGTTLDDFASSTGEIEALLNDRFAGLTASLTELGTRFGVEPDMVSLLQSVRPEQLMGQLGTLTNALTGLLSNSFVIVLLTAFMLLELRMLPAKMQTLRGAGVEANSNERSTQIVTAVRKYIVVKTVVAMLTGVTAGVSCWLIGVPHAPLWGLLAFVFDFVPALGSIIAMIPPAIVALVTLGVGPMVLVFCAFLAINGVVGNVLEPRLHGEHQGVSPLFVFISLTFWGWVFGPVGMLLAVPLTTILKITLAGSKEFRVFSILMQGGGSSKSSEIEPVVIR